MKDRRRLSSLDTLTPQERSKRMGRVRAKGSKAEIAVRGIVHGLGYRYRLHAKDLPGKPDIVFRKRKKIIFVHGCFWHRHEGCCRARFPKSPETADWWRVKLLGNEERDVRTREALRGLGWDILVIWECETEDTARVEALVTAFLGPRPHPEKTC